MLRSEIRAVRDILIRRSIRYSSNNTHVYKDELYEQIIGKGYKGLSRHIIPEKYGNSQVIASKNEAQLGLLMDKFRSPIKTSIGYGSGVFEQSGYKKLQKPQIDMIYMVDDAEEFHTLNLKQYPEHYSGLKILGSKFILKIQNTGAGVYFNPYILLRTDEKKKHIIKYGVVSVERSLEDLCEWSSLYIAGRLQKPVKFLKDADPAVKFLNQYNLKNAISLGLFFIKTEEFTELKLYETIARISYMGDPRMLIGGENPNKAKNIVGKQYANFQTLYKPLLNYFIENRIIVEIESKDSFRSFRKNLDIDKTSEILGGLPLQFRKKLYKRYESKFATELSQDVTAESVIKGDAIPSNGEIGPFTRAIAMDPLLRKNLLSCTKFTVAIPALVQTIKGIFSAGIIKSINYAWEKNTKYRQG